MEKTSYKNKDGNEFIRYCTWVVVLSPMLDSYVFSFLPSIPIQSILYIVIFTILLAKIVNRYIKFEGPIGEAIIVTAILIIISILDIVVFGIGINFVADFGKLLSWGASLYLFSGFIQSKYLKQVIIKVAVFNAVVVLIQSLFFYVFGIKLSNVFNFGIIMPRVNDMSRFITAYRPAALFSEPATYSVFALMTLSLTLLDAECREKMRTRWPIILIILSLIFSASTTGLALLLLVIAYSLIIRFHVSPLKVFVIATSLVATLGIFILNIDNIISRTGSFGRVISQSVYKINNTEKNARMGRSLDRIDFSDENILFGYGVGNEYYKYDNKISYMNSVARSVLQYGIIGTSFIFAFLIMLFLKSSGANGKLLIGIVFVLMFTSNILFSTSHMIDILVVYLTDIKSKNTRLVHKRNNRRIA